MKLKTLIFDLDGTLLDTIPGLHQSVNAALEVCGYEGRTLEEVTAFVGNGLNKLIERALPGGLRNPDYDRCLSAFLADYEYTLFSGAKPYGGILPMLETLRQEGYHMAVVSNKQDIAVRLLNDRYFPGLIGVAIGEKRGVARKPAPDSVYAALKELGVTAAGAAYIGDSEVDIETARNAGLPCFSVTWGTRSVAQLLAAGATTLCHTPEELLETIHTYE